MNKFKSAVETEPKDYKYHNEISQMMFVFGEVQDPDGAAVNLVEDIVRGQILETVIQAKQLSLKRMARTIQPEDLLFIIRGDRAKVNRLRTYMSWKDVRKNAKEPGRDGKAEVEVEDVMDEDNMDAGASKPKKKVIKLSWEIGTIYGDVLKKVVANHPERHAGPSDDEDDDDQEANEDSVKRLKDADELTRNMTKEEYVHYSECRQASFTFKKGKRFREFLNLPAHLDFRSDDTIDILGFLAFETVRTLTLGALEVKRLLETAEQKPKTQGSPPGLSRKRPLGALGGNDSSPSKRPRVVEEDDHDDLSDLPWGGAPKPVPTLFLPPPEARTPLEKAHILDAFARMQREETRLKVKGMRNWRGGLARTRVSLI